MQNDLSPAVLFDLDGTLTDPYPGISASILYALERLGRDPVPDSVLREAVGPPLEASFAAMLGGDFALAKEALAFYRERYSGTGLFENRVFEGIPETLTELRSSGLRLFLASSKPRVFCERILDHFDLTRYFDAVHGSELGGRLADKRELITHLLSVETIDRGQCVMVGDRRHDVEGARENGIRVVAVGWGYGSPEELSRAGPNRIIDSVGELGAAIRAELGLAAS